MSNLVILDRDGVINEDSDDYIRTLDEWIPVHGSIEAIARLSRAGYRIGVATNQSGLARGYFDDVTLANMHALLCELVEEAGGQVDAICYCPHGPDDGCRCRKPAPGLLEQISAELQLPIRGSWYVGDTAKDMELALAAGCRPLLVRTGKGRQTETSLEPAALAAVTIVDDLAAAADHILRHTP
ncbi:MAG TPA: D-glycero-beta-D-manno-heptose 1,7-bisphosphate 7-phosphatase [Pseudomonadales bacterium]